MKKKCKIFRIISSVVRVARGGSGAKAPPLAARPSTVPKTGQIPDCGFYLPVSMSRDDSVLRGMGNEGIT